MNAIEKAAVLRRVELIADDLRLDAGGGGALALSRLDALADDLRNGLHAPLLHQNPDSDADYVPTFYETGGEMA